MLSAVCVLSIKNNLFALPILLEKKDSCLVKEETAMSYNAYVQNILFLSMFPHKKMIRGKLKDRRNGTLKVYDIWLELLFDCRTFLRSG